MEYSLNEVMVVDDTPANLKLLKEILQKTGYNVSLFRTAMDAISSLEYKMPNIILMDINMPEMDGYEACAKIKEDKRFSSIPIIFISALSQIADKVEAFKRGGVDYITKPFEFEEVTERIKIHLQISQLQHKIMMMNESLEIRVAEQVEEIIVTNKKLVSVQNTIILALAKLSECRDDDTGQHLERVGFFCEAIAKKLKGLPLYSQVNDEFIRTIKLVAPLHDIGKVGIADNILLKPGRLDPEEFAVMKTHVQIGADTFFSIKEKISDIPYVEMAYEVILYHHERYDGSGYPNGLKGDDIPLSAQIMALADVYDALRSKRPYKQPMTPEAAQEIINKGKGTHFAPNIVDVFNQCTAEFDNIFDQLVD